MSGPAGDRDELSLAALATRLSGLSQRLDELERRLRTNEGAVEGHAATLAEAAGLAHEVERLARLVEGHATSGSLSEGTGGRPPHPWNWEAASDSDSVKYLRDLAEYFVTDILVQHYPHMTTRLPPCWPAHDAVVRELYWLYWDWETWAVSGQGRSRDAADWHDRWLPGVITRITPLLAACAAAPEHVKPEYTRPEHPALVDPTYPPDRMFIEQMGRAVRADIRRMGGFPE